MSDDGPCTEASADGPDVLVAAAFKSTSWYACQISTTCARWSPMS